MANELGWQSQSLPTNSVSGNVMIEEPPTEGPQSLQAGFRHPLKSTLTVKTHRDSLRSSWGASNRAPKSIVWRDVNVRQYEVTVGDNPSVSSGPPLSINWIYHSPPRRMSVDAFEQARPSRRSQMELVLTREEREDLLENVWNVPRSEISRAVRSILRLKNQRRTTVTNLSTSTKLEEVIESAGRKCKRAFSFQRRPSVKAAQLTKEHMAAEAQRKAIWDELVKNSDHLGEKAAAMNKTQKRPRALERSSDNSIQSAPAALHVTQRRARPSDVSRNEDPFDQFGDRRKLANDESQSVHAETNDAATFGNDFEPSWNYDAIRHSEGGNVMEAVKEIDASKSPKGKKKKKKSKKGSKEGKETKTKKKRSASLS
ncbi:hypothetical protein MHU86_25333 [Fragilaria crotonensis]|nr:hypothetical protein MHU86_25333 [Fragilaria crotonensis]